MRQVKLYRYQLPIQTGVVLRKQPLKERQGVLVCLQEQEKSAGRNCTASKF